MIDTKLLLIYLNDHLAGSLAGYELARRARSNNDGNDVGRYLDTFLNEVEEERATLETLLRRLGGRPNVAKMGGAWVAEKLGRGKLNGRLRSYSPLSRLWELEGLCIGVEGKLSLWRSLQAISSAHPEVAKVPLDMLTAQAETQRMRLEELRRTAAEEAFSSG